MCRITGGFNLNSSSLQWRRFLIGECSMRVEVTTIMEDQEIQKQKRKSEKQHELTPAPQSVEPDFSLAALPETMPC